MSDNESTTIQRQRFDRILGTLDGLPGVKQSRPATVMQTVPIVNETSTAVVQTIKDEDGYMIFLQLVDSTGHMRIVLPSRVADAIYRQRKALADRSTPESRARERARREREKARAERERRRAEWRRRHPDGGPLARARATKKPAKTGKEK